MKISGSCVGSMLLDFLFKSNVEVETLHFFADNAASQDKNPFIFALLSMISIRVIAGMKRVRLSFMTSGHTKFALDSWFGLLKKLLKLFQY